MSSSTYDREDYKELLSTLGIEVTDVYSFTKSEIVRVCQDDGAFGSSSFYLFHKKESNYYHRLDNESKYIVGQIWNSDLLQTCSYIGEASDYGQWVKKELSSTSGGNEEIKFNYEPQVDSVNKKLAKLKPEGIYRLVNGKLLLYGKLTNFCSYHDIDSGLFYLTPPSIFYTQKMSVKELENRYD
jgi:hypothetical protein